MTSATFWPIANPGARYWRAELPALGLQRLGWDTNVLDLQEEVDGASSNEDVFRNLKGPGVFQIVGKNIQWSAMGDVKRLAGRVYLELDDDYSRYYTQYARGWIPGDPQDWFTDSTVVHRRAAAYADAIITSTPHLQSVYKELNDNVYVCRNAIEPSHWPQYEKDESAPFRIAFAGSPNSQDLVLIQKAMEWAAKQPGVEAWIVGFNPRWPGVKSIPWMSNITEYREKMAKLSPDVGLRPIETTQFAKSKSDLKLLEYAMTTTLPIVTPFEPYIGWSGTEVRFAMDPKQWLHEVKWAVKNQDEARNNAIKHRERVLSERTIDHCASEWAAALGEASE